MFGNIEICDCLTIDCVSHLRRVGTITRRNVRTSNELYSGIFSLDMLFSKKNHINISNRRNAVTLLRLPSTEVRCPTCRLSYCHYQHQVVRLSGCPDLDLVWSTLHTVVSDVANILCRCQCCSIEITNVFSSFKVSNKMEGRVKLPFTELDWSSGRYMCSSRVLSVPTLARWTSNPKPKTRQRNNFKSSNIGNIFFASVVLSLAAMCAILGRTGADKYLGDVDISVWTCKGD